MQVQFTVVDEALSYLFFYGPNPRDVFERRAKLSAGPAVRPSWSFGLWLSTSFTTQYDEKTINEFVEAMAGRDILLSVFHFDCFWRKERHCCDFEWDAAAFPAPRAMLKRFNGKGPNVCLWINPYIARLSKLSTEGSEQGFFLHHRDGSDPKLMHNYYACLCDNA